MLQLEGTLSVFYYVRVLDTKGHTLNESIL